MNKSYICISILFFSLLFAACESGKSDDGLPLDDKGREDFSAFIDKFYSDIDFQLKRIEFPVLGKAGEDGLPTMIEEENWIILKPIDKKNPDYEMRISEKADDLMEHVIVVKRAFIINLQFNLNPVDKQWYLTYYSGVGAPTARKEANTEPQPENATIGIDSTTGGIEIKID